MHKLRFFLFSEDGAIALFLGLMLPLIIGIAGAGIDMARAMNLRSALTQSVDAVSQNMATLNPLCTSRATGSVSHCAAGDKAAGSLLDYAQKHITRSLNEKGFNIQPVVGSEIYVNPASGRIVIQVSAPYTCTIYRIIDPGCHIEINTAVSSSGTAIANTSAAFRLTGSKGELWAGTNESPGLPSIVTATGGQEPYEFSIGPNLPAGLKMNPKTGTISGTPLETRCANPCNPEERSVAISVRDSNDGPGRRREASAMLTYTIIHPLKLVISVKNLLGQHSIKALIRGERTGGKPPYRYACVNLPIGLACDPTTGEIIGIPEAEQEGDITIIVTDSRGKTAQASLPYKTVNQAYLSGRGVGQMSH